MPRKIIPIVEGSGEIAAVPTLLYKILHSLSRFDILVGIPQCADGEGNINGTDGLERLIRLAWKEKECAGVFVILDADHQCPVVLAQSLALRAKPFSQKHPIAIVVAKCEYETWFLASLSTIAGRSWSWANHSGLDKDTVHKEDIEGRVGVKGWISRQLPHLKGRPQHTYKEARDQEPLTHLIDIEIAKQNSRSFRRLCHAVEEIVDAMDADQKIITPAP